MVWLWLMLMGLYLIYQSFFNKLCTLKLCTLYNTRPVADACKNHSGVDFINCFLPYAELIGLYVQLLRSFEEKFGFEEQPKKKFFCGVKVHKVSDMNTLVDS